MFADTSSPPAPGTAITVAPPRPAPRRAARVSAAVIDCGEPQDRAAKLAARRAFVELKHDFMIAAAGLPGARGQWLRERVRAAEDPWTLWHLRHSVFAALSDPEANCRSARRSLHSRLGTLFGMEAGDVPYVSARQPLLPHAEVRRLA